MEMSFPLSRWGLRRRFIDKDQGQRHESECNYIWASKGDVMQQPGLDGRHRDKDGEISRKHGNTLVKTLRKIYGSDFADGFSDHYKLSDVLATLDEPSLTKLIKDHGSNTLGFRIAVAERTSAT